jgi:hypothetical protein
LVIAVVFFFFFFFFFFKQKLGGLDLFAGNQTQVKVPLSIDCRT